MARPCRPRGPTSRAEQVARAIDRGVAYLKRQQNADGTWPDQPAYTGGVTALCTLALLNAGVPPDDEAMQKALALSARAASPTQTYVVSLQTMVFCAAEPEKDLLLIRRNVKWLEDTQITTGDRKGAWSYPAGPAGGGGDPRTRQFALLALYEAERAGVPVNDHTWRLALQLLARTAERPTARGAIRPGRPGTRQHDLRRHHLADHRLRRAEPRRRRGRRRRRSTAAATQNANDAIERGLHWLERNFSVHINPSGAGRGARRQLAAVLPVRPGTRRPPDGPALHRPARLVSRRGRHAGPQPGQPVGLLEGHRPRTKPTR